MAERAAVEARSLRKTFQLRGERRTSTELVAVADVSFEVPVGGALAIVGESGSGKTTVANLLLGLSQPTSGSVTIAGELRRGPASRKRERKRRARQIQIVFQDPSSSLDPRQSGARCLDEILRFHFDMDSDARARRVAELGEQVGLSAAALAVRPRQLSGGQRQRVSIARALAAEPEVIVLDEAVAALDVSVQAQILNLLASIRRETQVAYVFVSHDLAVVRQVTDYAIVMHRGVVVEEGQTDRVLDSPQDPYTRLLRDSVPRKGWRPQRRTPGPV